MLKEPHLGQRKRFFCFVISLFLWNRFHKNSRNRLYVRWLYSLSPTENVHYTFSYAGAGHPFQPSVAARHPPFRGNAADHCRDCRCLRVVASLLPPARRLMAPSPGVAGLQLCLCEVHPSPCTLKGRGKGFPRTASPSPSVGLRPPTSVLTSIQCHPERQRRI